jgi:hypothetical protein
MRRKRVHYPTVLTAVIEKHVSRLDALPDAECFPIEFHEQVGRACQPTLDELIKRVFHEDHLTDENRALLGRLAVLTLVKDTYSESLTGIVIAGFGSNPFPRLMSFEMDGIICGKLKKKEVQRVNTDAHLLQQRSFHLHSVKWLTDFYMASIQNLRMA